MSRLILALPAAAISLTSLVACPGTKSDKGGPNGPDDGTKDTGPEDKAIDYEAVALPGTYFVPEGLELRPLMLMATGKKTLAKQRTAYKNAKPATRVIEAEVLATMLYLEAQKLTDGSARLTMVEEARRVLADTRAAMPTKVDIVLLHNLGCLSYDVGDPLASADAFGAAVALAPDDPGTTERRAYQAYYLVRAGKNAEALAAVGDAVPSKDEPELAYAIAWTSWRTGDLPRARAGMLAAAAGWRLNDYLPAVHRDVAIFAARTGADIDESIAMANAYARGDKAAAFEITSLMHQAFTLVGRYADAAKLVDRLLASDAAPSKATTFALHFEKADSAKALGQSTELVAAVQAGLAALAACNGCAGADTAVKLVFNYARFANYLYTTSQDERWYQAAKELYAAYLAAPKIPDAADVKAEADTLDRGHERALKGAGVHDKDAIRFVLVPYQAQVLACYDAELQSEATLGGALTLRLEVAQSGEVAGASAEPPAGDDGIAAVAGCAVESARTWVFPARTRPGVTRIAVSYTLSPSTP